MSQWSARCRLPIRLSIRNINLRSATSSFPVTLDKQRPLLSTCWCVRVCFLWARIFGWHWDCCLCEFYLDLPGMLVIFLYSRCLWAIHSDFPLMSRLLTLLHFAMTLWPQMTETGGGGYKQARGCCKVSFWQALESFLKWVSQIFILCANWSIVFITRWNILWPEEINKKWLISLWYLV